MTEPTYENLDQLRADALQQHVLEEVAEADDKPDSAFEFFADDDHESKGFRFLADHGSRAVQAFKLLEIAQTQIGSLTETGGVSPAEWSLLSELLGPEFIEEAAHAYIDCKERTHNLEDMHDLDARTCWRLTEFVHLYENVMRYGERMGRLTRIQATKVLIRLIHDFGEYYGLLVDDVSETKAKSAHRLAHYLAAFRRSEHFTEKMPVEQMTRLSLEDKLARELFHFEVARGIPPHPLLVRERDIHGNTQGVLDQSDPVEFVTHKLDLQYAMGLDPEEAEIVNAILPVFAVSVFEGFDSLAEVEEYIAKEQRETELHEQQCFAMLECLEHYGGRVPSRMAEFDAGEVMKAAQRVYRDKAKENFDRAPSGVTSITGMLKAKVSGVFQSVRPIAFTWPESRAMYVIQGYPEDVRFFPQHVTIGTGEQREDYTFLCHAHLGEDPEAERPKMFEYQTVIGEGLLFDAHAACRDGFSGAPDTFRLTLDAGQHVAYAKEVIHPGEANPSLDVEETKLLATFVALHGGMQSWLGQRYVLSEEGADIFDRYPDIAEYVSKLPPVPRPR